MNVNTPPPVNSAATPTAAPFHLTAVVNPIVGTAQNALTNSVNAAAFSPAAPPTLSRVPTPIPGPEGLQQLMASQQVAAQYAADGKASTPSASDSESPATASDVQHAMVSVSPNAFSDPHEYQKAVAAEALRSKARTDAVVAKAKAALKVTTGSSAASSAAASAVASTKPKENDPHYWDHPEVTAAAQLSTQLRIAALVTSTSTAAASTKHPAH